MLTAASAERVTATAVAATARAAAVAFDADPAHAEIEEKLYPAATDHVIWLTGQAIGS